VLPIRRVIVAGQLSGFLRFFVCFIRFYCFGFHFCWRAFFELTSVVGIQQDLFQLGDQRVTRVSTGTLVIERIFGQFVNVSKEVSFLNACFTD
jgi:hypothetical protein